MAFSFSVLDILTGSIVLIWYLVSIYLCYQTKIFWDNKKQQTINSRHPILSVSFIIIATIQSTITVPLQLLYYTEIVDIINRYYTSEIQTLVSDTFGMMLVNIFLLRVWLLFYDYQFNKSSFIYAFQSKICVSENNSNDNDKKRKGISYYSFWRRYKTRFGELNEITITILLLLSLPILFILNGPQFFNISFLIINTKYHNIIIFLLFLPTIIICTILTGFILPVNDSNYIRNELFIIIFIMICAATFIFSLFLIFEDHNNIYFKVIWHSFLNTSFLCIAYIKCKWVLNKWYKLQIKSSLINDINSQSINAYNNNNRTRSSSSLKKSQILTLQLLLKSKEGFEEFARYLMSELTLEHLLFLIEVSQFKAIIRKKLKARIRETDRDSFTVTLQTIENTIANNNAGNERYDEILLDNNILNVSWLPMAEEIYDLSPYRHGMYIHQKYIGDDIGTKYSINISFENRYKITQFFNKSNRDKHEYSNNKQSIYDLYYIFDSTFNEVWQLLQRDSFIRFLRTPQYNQLFKILAKKGTIPNILNNNHNKNQNDNEDIDDIDVEIEYQRRRISANDLQDLNQKRVSNKLKSTNFHIESQSHTKSDTPPMPSIYSHQKKTQKKRYSNTNKDKNKTTEKVDKMETIPADSQL